jgi:hypothetical protein
MANFLYNTNHVYIGVIYIIIGLIGFKRVFYLSSFLLHATCHYRIHLGLFTNPLLCATCGMIISKLRLLLTCRLVVE